MGTRGDRERRGEASLVVGALLRSVWPAAAAAGAVAVDGAERAAYPVGLVTYVVAMTVQLRHTFVRRWFDRT